MPNMAGRQNAALMPVNFSWTPDRDWIWRLSYEESEQPPVIDDPPPRRNI
jgi:hypothetical protein